MGEDLYCLIVFTNIHEFFSFEITHRRMKKIYVKAKRSLAFYIFFKKCRWLLPEIRAIILPKFIQDFHTIEDSFY